MLVSATSAAFDNNMSYYLYLKEFNTVRTNTIRNVNTEELIQRHLLAVASTLERQNNAGLQGNQEPKGIGKHFFVLEKAQKDGKTATASLLLFQKKKWLCMFVSSIIIW